MKCNLRYPDVGILQIAKTAIFLASISLVEGTVGGRQEGEEGQAEEKEVAAGKILFLSK